MLCVHLNEDGNLVPSTDTVDTCGDYVLIAASDMASYLDIVQITSGQCLAAYTFGLSVMIGPSLLIYCARLVHKSIQII